MQSCQHIFRQVTFKKLSSVSNFAKSRTYGCTAYAFASWTPWWRLRQV